MKPQNNRKQQATNKLLDMFYTHSNLQHKIIKENSEIDPDDIDRLEEILNEIKDLVEESQGLIPRDSIVYKRATAYWIPHILGALDKDNEYLCRSMITMSDSIKELRDASNTKQNE